LTYLDEACTRPVYGTVGDVYQGTDGFMRFVVMFEHNEPMMPPGGEFVGQHLEFLEA
jgi:hypothetical protein